MLFIFVFRVCSQKSALVLLSGVRLEQRTKRRADRHKEQQKLLQNLQSLANTCMSVCVRQNPACQATGAYTTKHGVPTGTERLSSRTCCQRQTHASVCVRACAYPCQQIVCFLVCVFLCFMRVALVGCHVCNSCAFSCCVLFVCFLVCMPRRQFVCFLVVFVLSVCFLFAYVGIACVVSLFLFYSYAFLIACHAIHCKSAQGERYAR